LKSESLSESNLFEEIIKRPKVMQARGIPAGMPQAMGSECKANSVNSYTCARDRSYNPSTPWLYYTDPITLNPFGFDLGNNYFSVYMLGFKVLFIYDQLLDI
jgi:hypothetical protein